jgi:hypothetical protein
MNPGERFVVGHTDYANVTTVHPVGLALLLFLGVAMLFVPRRYTMFVLFICASFIAVAQRVVVGGLDFNFIRLMVLFAWTRILIRQEFQTFRWNRLDYCIIAWNIVNMSLFPISHGSQFIITKLGGAFDSAGMYFLIRILIKDLTDLKTTIYSISLIAMAVVCVFVIENRTQRNLFAAFGGVPEITQIREGKLRCQGAYAHPILAGCFWAALVPLIGARALAPGMSRIVCICGLISALGIVGMSNSSTSLIGVFAAMIGMAMFPLRRNMRIVRWALVIFLCCLQMVMISPIYTLIARITLSSGNTGAHRSKIIESAIKYFPQWALCGTGNIDHWGIFANDITNKYVGEAISGGLLQLTLFITLIVYGFGNIGRLWRIVGAPPSDVLLSWSIGVALFVHVTNFIGIQYFGQNEMLWNFSLATTATLPGITARNRQLVAAQVQRRRLQAAYVESSTELPLEY